jgi:hypothetical protein
MSAVISVRKSALPSAALVDTASLRLALGRVAALVLDALVPARPGLAEHLCRDAGLPHVASVAGIDWTDADARRIRI